MQVVFYKQKHRTYTVVVNRCDRVKLQFNGVGKKFLVPHDLSHLIVESKLDDGAFALSSRLSGFGEACLWLTAYS